jgi:glycerol-3-phosphate dehydrogenase (NAD(P)+)
MAGALKNVMAISSGSLTGIGYGANTRGFLLSRGLAELMRLAEKMHADPITLSGLAGVGDLFVTCSSEQSRNFRVGMRIGSGESVRGILDSMHQVAEGVRTVQAAYELAKQFNLSLPIIETIYQIVYHEMSLSEASAQLLGRPMKFELNPERIVHD